MAEIMLDCPGVLPVVGELVAGAVPKHVAVDKEREAGSVRRAGHHALVAGHAQRRQALGYEDMDRPQAVGGLALEPAQRTQLLAAEGVDRGHAALGAPHMQLAGREVDVVPTQGNKLAGA